MQRLTMTALSLAAAAHAGKVVADSLASAAVGRKLEYLVILPDRYAADSRAGKRFPVVYLLHCAGCRDSNWVMEGGDYDPAAPKLVDSVNLIAVAADDGGALGWWMDSPVRARSAYSTYLAKELKPRIDSRYATLPGPRYTGVAGHSMGGFGAIHNLIAHPEAFGAAYAIKGGMDLLPWAGHWGLDEVLGKDQENWRKVNPVDRACALAGRGAALAFYSGPGDFFVAGNRELDRRLKACGVPHRYSENGEPHPALPRASMAAMLRYFDSTFAAARKAAPARAPAGGRGSDHLGQFRP